MGQKNTNVANGKKIDNDVLYAYNYNRGVIMSDKIQERSNIVVKSNELIQESKFSLTIQQQKIVAYIISQINPFDEDFKLYEFNIIKFCEVCGIDSRNGTIYKNLKKHIRELSNKSMWIEKDNGVETLVRWIEKPYIDKENGTIKIQIDSDLKPYLLQLTENFTTYELGYTLNFSSKYSFRLYELIKSLHYNKLEEYKHRIEIETLKQRMDATNYDNFKDFNRRALKPAIKEINTYSDTNIEYNSIYSGRKIIAIELILKIKSPADRLKNFITIKNENEVVNNE